MDALVVYHLRPLSAGARLLEVCCRILEPDPAGQLVSLPAWTPGSYLIRDFARHVVAIEARGAGGAVPIRKVDKATWRAAPVSGELLIRAEIYAGDPSVRGACLDAAGAFVNGASVFMRVHGREAERCVLHVIPGDDPAMAGWQLATTLSRVTGADWEYGAFEADGYEELIDHPILVGSLARAEFEAGGVPHAIALAGRHDADLTRLTDDLARLCGWQIDFFGRPAPMTRYLFLVRLNGEGFGGLEHRSSTALVCHRNDLPRGGANTPGPEYRKFLGLASHEYFHLWNGKRIRPAEFAPHGLDREVYSRQLWIVEGITSYYDDLALLRAGLISVPSYLELLGRMLTSLYRTAGRRRQTLEEASFDAWIKFYRPDENSPNSQVSYYTKGAIVALALDLETRLRTNGRVSLDDVMRVLWQTHGREPGHDLPEGAFEELAAEVTGLDLGEFFRSNLRATVDPPVGILLAQFGVRLSLRVALNASDPGGTPNRPSVQPRAWFGVRTRRSQGRIRVTHVLDDGPAQQAGILTDDEIVAVQGIRADADGFEALVGRLAIGRPAEVHVFRRDELLHITLTPVEPPRDTCYLVLDEQATEQALARRQQWLGQSAVSSVAQERSQN
jgi:predicted metalloprotease with PDZ domain